MSNENERKQYQKMTTVLTTLAIILMYVMWICCVFHQMYPLIIPDLTKHIEEELLELERYK